MGTYTINKKTIKQGVFYKINKTYKMKLSVYKNGHFHLSTSAAHYLNLKTPDFVQFAFTDDQIFLEKATSPEGFKAVENPESNKKYFRFASITLAEFFIERFKPKKHKPLKFALEPASTKVNSLKLIILT